MRWRAGLAAVIAAATLVIGLPGVAGATPPDPGATSTTGSSSTTTAPTTTTAPLAPSRPNRGGTVQLTPTAPPPVTQAPSTQGLPAGSGTGRRVVYSNSQMRVWAVDANGVVVKTHRVSGKRGIPRPGTYYVYSRSLYTSSVANPSIKWMYMVRFAYTPSGGRVGFHEIPTQCSGGRCWKMQTEAQLGQGLSGGCVRQSTPDAIWMWNWAGIGTKVVVLP